MAGRLSIPVKMIDVENNDEVVEIYKSIDDCAYDNRISVDTIRTSMRYKRITRTGHRFEKAPR